ncbi:MAG: 16S rRNA (adenine(1518)-N(6)/adenine(1519)-N(6))-dimethyltransferase RsmA, partial [Pirellulales bacterium]
PAQTMPKRQTASFLIRTFKEAGIRPDPRRGQNFLVDLNLLKILVDEAAVGPRDVVLEVGTGLGSLTALLAQRAAAVVTVEIDRNLQQLASEQLVDFNNVTMLCQDALKNKNNLHSNLMEAVRNELSKGPDRTFRLAANLPYCIATPVISNLLSTDISPVSMTVTIQKELADRIVAQPNSKDYNALSIWLQSQCRTQILRVMPPTVFWPRPKVHSAIVQIVLDPEKRDRIPDRKFFHSFVRSMFLHRRKFLRGVMVSAFKESLSKPDVDHILERFRLGPETRAEQLDVETMLALSEAARHETLSKP